MKAVNGPLPHVRMMPTGGINLNNFVDWLDMGALAVGIGSDLTHAYRENGEVAVVEKSKQYMEKLQKRKEE